jgi:hypothetical protein
MTIRSLTRGMSAVFVSIVLSGTWAVRGQCTKDTDCKGDRICVKGVCTAPGQNASSAQPSSQQNSEAVSQPSEAEVKACVAALEGLGGMYGSVLRVEYGAPMSSQGGMTEMDLGAPKGTSIYPVRLRFHDYRTAEAWLYRDPFGTLKCARHGNVEYAPPTTPEEMSAAIKDGETVRVPVKLFSGYAPNMHFVAGTLAVSTKSLVLTAPESTGFNITMDHVYPVDSQNWQLHIRLEVEDPYRHNLVGKDVYFWDPGVQQGRGSSVDCSRCGNAMSMLLSLIRLAHNGQQ